MPAYFLWTVFQRNINSLNILRSSLSVDRDGAGVTPGLRRRRERAERHRSFLKEQQEAAAAVAAAANGFHLNGAEKREELGK